MRGCRLRSSALRSIFERAAGVRFPGAVSLIFGGAIILLVAFCVVVAWPAGSMAAAQPASESTGDVHWIRLFALAQIVAFGLFTVGLLIIRRSPTRTRHVLIIAATIQLLPLAAPPLLSTDVYSYWNSGRLAVSDGSNPYRDVPSDYPSDPSFQYKSPEWRDRPTVYGPVFTEVAAAVALSAGERAGVAAWLFKLMAGASMLVLTVLVSRMAQRAAFAAAFVGWNPVFAIQFAGSGHNDVLMITLVVLGLGFVHRRNVPLAAGLWSLALFVKSLILILIPLQVLEDRARGRPSLVPGLTVWILGLVILATLSFGWFWLSSFASIVERASSEDLNSLAIWPRVAPHVPDVIVKLAPLLGFAIAYAVLLGQAWRGRARRGLAMGLFLLASPFLWTWYVITPAALAAVEDDEPALLIAFGLCVYTSIYLGASGNVFRILFG